MHVRKPSRTRKTFLSVLFAVAVGVIFLRGFAAADVQTQAEPTVALSMQYALDEKSVADLTRVASYGDCKAAERLGLFYHTVRAHDDDENKYSAVARKWYEVANRCMADPRLKEFLISMIIRDGYSKVAANEVKDLFMEIEVMDPERATRMRDRINEFTHQQDQQELQR